MKFKYIVNEVAGKGKQQSILKKEIEQLSSIFDCSYYVTTSEKDAVKYIKKYLSEERKDNEDICFVACGGDGTINEVFSSVIGIENAYVSVYPCGSGNDFVKVFDKKDYFVDIKRLMSDHKIMPIDLLKIGDTYSVNVINLGFDTTVAEVNNIDRKKTGHGSKFSFTKGIVKALFTSMKTKVKIYADGELLNPEGELLLCSFANGQYYGGSFKCAPNAQLDDGLIEVCIVKPISRLRLVSLISCYTEGTHLVNEKMKDIIVYRQAKRIDIKAEEVLPYTIDGEIAYDKELSIEVVPKLINLLLPNDYK